MSDGSPEAYARPVPAAPAPSSARLRRPWWWALAGALVVGLGPVLVVQAVGQAAVQPGVASVAPKPVALVLGAGLEPDGTPSVYLARRLEAARQLFAAGTVQVILVSGDNSTPYHDEPGAMRTWLLQHGVPDAKIVRDAAGFDTHDSCVRARQIFGVTSAVVVTQDYHLRRALFSCRAAGIDSTGVGVSAASVTPRQAVVWRLREVPASWKAAWDALTHRRPVFLGRPEDGVRTALANPSSQS
ncbi:MAG: YdcF family protein [Cellulomonas sp.]|nr:YdcF family protein [Cellulomonas sp.]